MAGFVTRRLDKKGLAAVPSVGNGHKHEAGMILQVGVYAFTLWLGAYIIERAGAEPGARYAGAGLMGYAAGLGAVTAGMAAARPVALLIAPLWALVIYHLWHRASNLTRGRRIALLGYMGALFFILTGILMWLPLRWLTIPSLLLALSMDVTVMGVAVIWLYTAEAGEGLWRDAVRSLLLAAFGTLLLGGQVALLLTAEVPIEAVRLVLLGVVGTVVLATVFGGRVARLLDRLLYPGAVTDQRAELQQAADGLARTNPAFDPVAAGPDEFARLTRRALGAMNRLGKLVASPLLALPLIDAHPAAADGVETALERAAVLRALLTDQIEKLRPADGSPGITDDWRHYNALYFPYVAGIKPYSARLSLSELDADTRSVIEWFRVHVPERTLYNWQTAAARVIAADLWEQLAT
jgi:hypothetical protein